MITIDTQILLASHAMLKAKVSYFRALSIGTGSSSNVCSAGAMHVRRTPGILLGSVSAKPWSSLSEPAPSEWD